MKKFFALILAVLFVLAMATGCSDQEKTDGDTDTLRVTVVVAGRLGDASFYDSAAEGLDRLKNDYGLVTTVTECNEDASMYQTKLVNAAETSDVVVAVGWEFGDALPIVAAAMPDVKFIYIDEAIDGVSNIMNIKYAQNEGSFLVGYIAAKMSETGFVGAVGGMDNDTINDFYVGYKQGAEYANKDCKVKIVYAGTFSDPTMGKECALALYNEGADVVFQIAGQTGEGVFDAAKDVGKYAIGVDSDQKHINEDVIICSMKKEVGDSIYDAIVAYMQDGTFHGGETVVTNMEQGYIDAGYGEEGAKQQVPDSLKAEVEELKTKIVSGEIVVETTRGN